MSTISPAVELAQPHNKPSVQYIQDVASKPDFDFPQVSLYLLKLHIDLFAMFQIAYL